MAQLVDNKISQICVAIQSEDKKRKRQALQDIVDDILKSAEEIEENELLELWEYFHRPVVRLLNDGSEACRDLAIDVLKTFLITLPCSDKHIVYVIPILARRLSSQELIEPSEEVRLKCIILLIAIVEKYQDKLAAYFEDFVNILSRTVTDNYPKIKKESCTCICAISKYMPSNFYSKSEKFVHPILGNISHQHHKIRLITVQTICVVLLQGDGKLVSEVATPLAQRLFDQSSVVRLAVVEVAGKLMLEFKDRYSYWYKLIPLLLTCYYDEMPEIREKVVELWDEVGELFMKENASDEKFKNKMDYLTDHPQHYPPDVRRPNLGCRTLVKENLCKLVGAIGRELRDWLEDIRLRSAQLLCVLVLNAEEDITMNLQKLLPPMYRACNDECKRVSEIVTLAAEYMGYFVPPKIYCDLVIPTLEENPTSGHLRIFGAILRGSPRNLLLQELEKIGKFLNQKHIYESGKKRYQNEILNCCNALLHVCQEDCATISEDLFVILFTVLSMATDNTIFEKLVSALDVLAKVNKFDSLTELYTKYLDMTLTSISEDCHAWTIYHPPYKIFCAAIRQATSATYRHLDHINYIFENTTKKDVDAEVRLKQFILLADYLKNWDSPFSDHDVKTLVDFANKTLKNVIIPGMVWSAGRTAEAIRTASVCCLCSLLNKIISNCEKFSDPPNEDSQNHPLPINEFAWLFDKVIPILVTLLEDPSHKTRLLSLQAMCLVVNIGQETQYLKEDHIHKTSPEIISRLEDSHDEVRLAAIQALREIWKILPTNYDYDFYRVHIEYAYSNTLIHLDDPRLEFQQDVLDCLKDIAKVNPELLIQKISECHSKFINQKAIDQLKAASEDYLIKKVKNKA